MHLFKYGTCSTELFAFNRVGRIMMLNNRFMECHVSSFVYIPRGCFTKFLGWTYLWGGLKNYGKPSASLKRHKILIYHSYFLLSLRFHVFDVEFMKSLKYFTFCFWIYFILRLQTALHSIKVWLRIQVLLLIIRIDTVTKWLCIL